ncbi:MAG TPA: TIGR04283 family arsenosugar biosynthesis glycosyltransferase [Thermoanaerobaculia bacterium]|nr:TIGR04283 family arsenosugar biosynthesis glycosyltransferase [Thermoanaerobaculia bacterium]
MSLRISAVIPSLNEERTIADSIRSARAAGIEDIVVSDGGSTDATMQIAGDAGARVMNGEVIRARQLNKAAATCDCDVLLFLHADTLLPSNAADTIRSAVQRGFDFGGFRISFFEQERKLKVAAAMINLRTSLTRCPWGDQGQFITREAFERGGGFREMPIMEDYELALRMKRIGKPILLREKVQTSGRRFLRKGVWVTAATNWRIIIAYRTGTSPERLRQLYRGK